MGNMINFEELKIWQEARRIVGEIYKCTAKNKDFGFNDQIQRAAVSVMNNIAEGHEYGGRTMYQKYLKISLGSCGEVRSMLYLALDLNYIDKTMAEQLIHDCKGLAIGIVKFSKSFLPDPY